MTTSFSERVFWHQHTYGQALVIPRGRIAALLTTLAVLIPVFFPLAAVPVLMRTVFREQIVIRYGGNNK